MELYTRNLELVIFRNYNNNSPDRDVSYAIMKSVQKSPQRPCWIRSQTEAHSKEKAGRICLSSGFLVSLRKNLILRFLDRSTTVIFQNLYSSPTQAFCEFFEPVISWPNCSLIKGLRNLFQYGSYYILL